MKTLLSLLSAIALQIAFAQLASAQSTNNQPDTAQSGITVRAWYPGHCYIEPPAAPWCTMPRPYYGTFSILTVSGHYVVSGSTAENITATFTVYLKPGRYIILPDDPALIEDATTVTIRAKEVTDVLISIGED